MAGKKKEVKKSIADKPKNDVKKPVAKTKASAPSRAKDGASDRRLGATRKVEDSEYPEFEPTEPDQDVASPEDEGPDAEVKQTYLSQDELLEFEKLLLNLRDQVVDEISSLTADNLSGKTFGRTGEEGTDNFNREFALKLVSSEQDIIYEIDEALRRIATGTYGMCEFSGEPIEKERLKVMPHARHCVRVQSELERGRIKYRPFAPPSIRGE